VTSRMRLWQPSDSERKVELYHWLEVARRVLEAGPMPIAAR
jgi:hypothetical protein